MKLGKSGGWLNFLKKSLEIFFCGGGGWLNVSGHVANACLQSLRRRTWSESDTHAQTNTITATDNETLYGHDPEWARQTLNKAIEQESRMYQAGAHTVTASFEDEDDEPELLGC